MMEATIPVDVHNPGQVFACLGFLEATEVLLGEAEGGFQWSDVDQPLFKIRCESTNNPFHEVLTFLAESQITRLAPADYTEKQDSEKAAQEKGNKKNKKKEISRSSDVPQTNSEEPLHVTLETAFAFPAADCDWFTLPVCIKRDSKQILLSHWCDGSSRNPFKLFAGRQRSDHIVHEMLEALKRLFRRHGKALVQDPFGHTIGLRGSSFKLDPRKSWTGIEAGYSPDEQGHKVEASPVVELLGAVGLEHARPDQFETRAVRYAIWEKLLPPVLARAALAGAFRSVRIREFRFNLELAGKNKVVTFAREETA